MIRFDTRDKKPKIYSILILTLVTAAIVIGLAFSGFSQHVLLIGITVTVYFILVVVFLLIAFFRQLQYNPYSYNTIYYIGFALFLFSVVIVFGLLTYRIAKYPEVYDSLQFVHALLGTAKTYMLLSFPFIVVFSIALCVSNISLLRHEGYRLVNVLGIVLSFLLVGGFLWLWKYDYYTTGSQFEVMVHDIITNLFAAAYLYFECMLLGTMVADAIVVRYEPELNKDFIIILGCGIRKDGTPTPLLRGRIDRAIGFYKKQKEQTGKELTFITSGGQGSDEVISESACMKQYLLEQGIPQECIIEEDRSTSTFENMKFSKEKILAQDPEGKVAFSTTNYHVFRSGLFARRVKMRAVGMGARTKWYFWPNAAVREFVGLLTEHRVKQAVIFGSLTVFYVVLTILAYQY